MKPFSLQNKVAISKKLAEIKTINTESQYMLKVNIYQVCHTGEKASQGLLKNKCDSKIAKKICHYSYFKIEQYWKTLVPKHLHYEFSIYMKEI